MLSLMAIAVHCCETNMFWPALLEKLTTFVLVLLEKCDHHLHCPMQLLETLGRLLPACVWEGCGERIAGREESRCHRDGARGAEHAELQCPHHAVPCQRCSSGKALLTGWVLRVWRGGGIVLSSADLLGAKGVCVGGGIVLNSVDWWGA